MLTNNILFALMALPGLHNTAGEELSVWTHCVFPGLEAPHPVLPPTSGVNVLPSIDEQARIDRNKPETAFVVGPNYYFKRDQGEHRYLVSLSVTTYQGLMYRVR